jgi:hypothetical protein
MASGAEYNLDRPVRDETKAYLVGVGTLASAAGRCTLGAAPAEVWLLSHVELIRILTASDLKTFDLVQVL